MEDAPLADDGEASIPAAPLASASAAGINLGYTINLHLPPTSDIAVFNAIFSSLREHLLPRG